MHRLFFILILLFGVKSYAVEVTGLTQGASPVVSKSDEEREKVLPEILRKVIIKLVGNRQQVEETELSEILTHADRYVQQYEYQRLNSVHDDLTLPDKLQLVVTFKPDILRQALLDLGLPLWSRSRPEILVWLVVDEQGKQRWIGADDTSAWKQRIKQAADERGLPVLLPVMDIEEQRLVTQRGLSAGINEAVVEASQRYGTPVILVAMANVDDTGMTSISWSARIGDELEKWESQGDKDTAVREGLGHLAAHLSARLAQYRTFSQAYPVKLSVSGVKDYADYVRLENYLNTLQYVSATLVSRIARDTVNMTLRYSGNMDKLNRILSIDHVLFADTDSAGNESNYRLAPR